MTIGNNYFLLRCFYLYKKQKEKRQWTLKRKKRSRLRKLSRFIPPLPNALRLYFRKIHFIYIYIILLPFSYPDHSLRTLPKYNLALHFCHRVIISVFLNSKVRQTFPFFQSSSFLLTMEVKKKKKKKKYARNRNSKSLCAYEKKCCDIAPTFIVKNTLAKNELALLYFTHTHIHTRTRTHDTEYRRESWQKQIRSRTRRLRSSRDGNMSNLGELLI